MSAPLIELKDASFSAQGKTIVKNISLAFNEGGTVALIGPSGGGKSSVLKLAAGLILPTSGEVRYRDQDISLMNRQQTLAFRKEAAFVFQDSALWANQTLRQSLELPLMIHFPKMTQNQRTARLTEVTAEVGYKKTLDIRPAQLSMGEQKLIAFARALVCGPRLLFLDEWTESLDDSASRRLVNAVKRMQQNGSSIVFVSHNFKVIREVAQNICVIVDGQVSMTVTAEEFATNDTLAKMIEKGIAL